MKRSLTAMATILAFSSGASAEDLRMSWWGGDSRHEATQAALLACGAAHGHTVAPEFTGWSGHLEKVTTQIAGGTEADIMQINWPWLPLFSLDGSGFADLNDYSEIIDLSQWDDATRKAATMNGALNGLPLSTAGRVFMFNKTTYDAAGLALPTSFEELIAAAPVMREKLGDDYYPFDGNGLNASLLMILHGTQSTGNDLINQETNEVAWSQDELTAAIEFYGSLVEASVIRPWTVAAAEGNVKLHENPLWADGHLAGSYEWDSTYFKYSDPMGEDQELVPVSMLEIEGAVTNGVYAKPSMVFAISANSKNPEAAAEIVNCMLTEETGITALGSTRGLPASAIATEILLGSGLVNQTQIDANNIVMNSTGPGISPFDEHPDVRTSLIDNLELYAYGEISAGEAAETMIADINEALEDY